LIEFVDQYPFEPNDELAGDTGAAFAGVKVGIAIRVAKARAAIRVFMTHLLLWTIFLVQSARESWACVYATKDASAHAAAL
jgi:hypothetical protein